MMSLAMELVHASGMHRHECSSLAHRWDANWPLAIDNGQSFVCDYEGEQNFVSGPVRSFYTGLWRGESGVVHASHFMGQLHHRAVSHGPWVKHRLMDAAYGVWGLDEETVFAWGSVGGKPAMARFDGTDWNSMPAPSRMLHNVHGCDPENVMAVGSHGLIAHWDGARWTELVSPVTSSLSSVFVASPDEIYACGPSERVLLEGSVYGFRPVLRHEHSLHAVAKYAGSVYVGAGLGGLHVLEDGELDPRVTELHAFRFDTRGALLISAPDRIAQTTDGQDYQWWWRSGIEALVADTPWP